LRDRARAGRAAGPLHVSVRLSTHPVLVGITKERSFMRIATAVALAAALLATDRSAAAGTPTFTKDVAPIFYRPCIECHRATMFAPMPLTSYEDARPWLRAIRNRVTATIGKPDAIYSMTEDYRIPAAGTIDYS